MANIAAQLGRPLFPWQRYVVDVGLEVDSEDLWAYDEVAGLAPRRSGKSFLMQALMAHRCARPAPALVAMTAQNGQEAAARWLEIVDSPQGGGIMQSPLAPLLHATIGTGNKFLSWPNGSSFYPFTPNERANHGSAPDLVFIDELWSFDLVSKAILQQGWRPAWSVKPGQEWLFSAAGTMSSGWLQDVRRRGRTAVQNPGARMALFDWGITEAQKRLKGDDLIRAVVEAHPRRDHGLRPGYVATELDTLGRAGFLRAYGNVDAEDDRHQSAVPVERLEALTTVERIPRGSALALGVAVDPQRREATICAAWTFPSGVTRVEVVLSAPGTRWVAAYVADMAPATVSVLGTGLGRDLADELDGLGLDVQRVSQADASAAAGRWLGTIAETDRVALDGSPKLEKALGCAEVPRRGGWWQSRNGEPITAVEAHTLALWGLGHVPEPEAAPAPFRIW